MEMTLLGLIDLHTDWCVTCGAEHSYMSGPCDKCNGKVFTRTGTDKVQPGSHPI